MYLFLRNLNLGLVILSLYQSKIFVQDAVENFDFSYNKTEIIRMMREDGFGELNWEDLRTNLNRISRENKQ